MTKINTGYFAGKPVLTERYYTVDKNSCQIDCSPLEYAGRLNGNFVVIATEVDKLRIGRLENGSFEFAVGGSLCNDKYLIELRIFNQDQEYLFSKRGSVWNMRTVCDKLAATQEDDGEKIFACIDSASLVFGTSLETTNDGFSRLFESGRKIELYVPDDKHKKYQLVTRSYIVYSKINGQARFGFSRYVAVEGVE